MAKPDTKPIPEDVLAEQWFAFKYKVWDTLIKAVRESGMTQKEIACRIGMAEEQLSRCMSGRKNVTLRTMHNLARAIDRRPEVRIVDLSSLTRPNFQKWEDGLGTETGTKKRDHIVVIGYAEHPTVSRKSIGH